MSDNARESQHDQVLNSLLDEVARKLAQAQERSEPGLTFQEIGEITSIERKVVHVNGLPSVQYEELVTLPGHVPGMVLDISSSGVGVIMLDESEAPSAGGEVRRTGRALDVPVGEALVGRVVDGIGRPLDYRGPVRTSKRLPIEREAPAIMDRAPVVTPLQTGIKVIDAMIPMGRGQRELILGDRQTGKTALAVDTIVNQRGKDVICVYCAIGKRASAVAKVIDDLHKYDAMGYSIVMVTTADEPPGMQFIAPYAATSMGEHFMQDGRDVLIVYDDLTCHARAYREVSLLMRRPPGREAYPGDIFYIHSRLLERSTHLLDRLGGGSLTALPIVETEAQNISGYIPTNLISITDGQIYLSPNLFRKGILPAVDVGKSVSRVGGKTQLKGYRGVVGDLKLAYSQFEELETFARFGTRMDEETRKTLERGRRVRKILQQPQYQPLSVSEQIAGLVAVNQGILDSVDLADVPRAEKPIRDGVTRNLPDIVEKIRANQDLTDDDRNAIAEQAEQAIASEGLKDRSNGNQ
jgi:F-type H+-transporting ATPase subunit alpha